MTQPSLPIVIHADESCLGNQNSGPSRGGAGAFLEFSSAEKIERKDWHRSSADTTNNQMALTGAIEVLRLIKENFDRRDILYYSDSQYLVLGITQWVHGWKKRGWTRKGGEVENLKMWQALLPLSTELAVKWQWVRGHSGHVKNEYADTLAVSAAEGQSFSEGLVPSGFESWLTEKQAKGNFSKFDADSDFHQHVTDYLHTA